MPIDDALAAFSELNVEWSGILIGNGASQVLSALFGYSSLYETACNQPLNPLTPEDQAIFTSLRTRNFEQVLSALNTTRLVATAFGHGTGDYAAAYDRIRAALVQAVRTVHIAHADVPEPALLGIRLELLRYSFVYSTNYDLLIYWSIMKGPEEFRDYFFGPTFDLGNTEIWRKSTRLLFLHGALHLYRTLMGGTYKRSAGNFGNLLEDFGSPIEGVEAAVPLFISEGEWTDKLSSIYNSDYLAFAYSQFARHEGPLVIYGQSLTEQYDRHLLTAIRSSPNREVGISIYPGSATADRPIRAIKTEWMTKLPEFKIHFFDSTTHPLGDPAAAYEAARAHAAAALNAAVQAAQAAGPQQ